MAVVERQHVLQQPLRDLQWRLLSSHLAVPAQQHTLPQMLNRLAHQLSRLKRLDYSARWHLQLREFAISLEQRV